MTTTKTPPPAKTSISTRAIGFLVAVAIVAFIAQYFAQMLPVTNGPRRDVVAAVTTFGPAVGWIAASAAVLIALIKVLHPLGHSAGSGHTDALTTALGYHLRLSPDVLRARAKRTRGRVISGQVRYPRGVGLIVEPEAAVRKALAPLAAGPLAVTHTPKARLIEWYPAPPEKDPHWWDDTPMLVNLHTNLAPLLTGLDIVQGQTSLTDDPDTTKITLSYSTTTKDISPAFRSRIHKIVHEKVPPPTGAWSVIWLPHNHKIVIKPGVPLPRKALIPLLSDFSSLPPRSLPLGLRRGGELALWRPDKHPHLLVAGPTGGGKSSLIRTLLVMALCAGWDLYLLDPKLLGYRRAYATGWGLSHDRIATRGDTMEAVVLAIQDEVLRRYRLCEWGLARPSDFPVMLLIIDENTEAIPAMNRAAISRAIEQGAKKLPRESEAVEGEWSIARLGRQVGVYLVLAHQRPDVSYIKGEARSNMRSVYSAGLLEPDGARMLFGKHHVDQRVTEPVVGENGEIGESLVEGRATVNLGNGIEPLQGFWTPDPAEPGDVPPGSEEAQRTQQLQAIARAAQARANHQLLPGIIRIDPMAEEAAARAELEARQRERQLAETDAEITTPLPRLDATGQVVAPPGDPTADGGASQSPPPGHPHNTDTPQDTSWQWVAPASATHSDQAEPDSGEVAEPDGAIDLVAMAAELVVSSQYGSTDMLRRKLRIGWTKAAQIMDTLQRQGIVGPSAGTKPRDVLVAADADVAELLDAPASSPLHDEDSDDEKGSTFEDVELDELNTGDVVQLELDGSPVEVTVESVVESVDDPDLIEIEYTTDDGQHGTLEIAADELVPRRR